ncbi:hypothetical protein MBLNU457_1630t1 [Dothideomycetes sp. NU457]
MKLKLNTSSIPNTPGGTPHATPTVQTPGGGGFKLKLKTSQPPTPAEGIPQAVPLGPPTTKPKRPYNKKPKPDDGPSKKRVADDDISPAAKRGAHERKLSVKFSGGVKDEDELPTPTSAKTKISLKRKPSIGPKSVFLTHKKRPPPRPIGVGYDSEASDAEDDPAIEQQFILRMAPGDDCDYLRQAIEDKKVGLRAEEGGADVSFKFIDKDLRRATVTIRGTKYAACMVELPCIIEGMKSWDRRGGGWWKVADICQMLLVLGRIRDEHEAKDYPLPREVDKSSFNYAHGLTPPMHWVRKRRFRKRVSYKEVENVDEEVRKLLDDDATHIRNGGEVEYNVIDANAAMAEDEDADAEVDADFMETTEDAYGQAYEDEEEDDEFDSELAAQLAAGLEDDDGEQQPPPVAADAAASLGDVLAGQRRDETPSSATMPAAESAAPTPTADASSDVDDDDDDDDDDDMDSPDAIDEDVLQLQAEEAQKREEVADLEREVGNKRAELERTSNLLLKQRIKLNLKALEEELAMKRKAFGMEEGDDDDE